MTTNFDPRTLDDGELLASLRRLVVRSNENEAQMLEHLAEVDERRLYLPDHTSLFAMCMSELGFSEAVAENRITVARAARRFPRLIEMRRTGRIHLSGLRILVPHLTDENVDAVLEQATRKSKRQIEELVASLAPRPAVPESIRKVPQRRVEQVARAPQTQPPQAEAPAPLFAAVLPASEASVSEPAPRPAIVSPLAPERYHVQLTASQELRDKIEEAKALLRHQVPSGDLATILDRALTVLIAKVKKERFGVGRKPRSARLPEGPARSRHIPDAIKRAVYTPSGGVMHPERDGGRCTFIDSKGHRCEQRAFLEFDHVHGFARRAEHTVAGLTLRCRSHNQYAAEVMYGSEHMATKRREARS